MSKEMDCLSAEYLRILRSKPSKVVSTEEALKDISPVDWPEDVLNGTRKVVVSPDDSQKFAEGCMVRWVAK